MSSSKATIKQPCLASYVVPVLTCPRAARRMTDWMTCLSLHSHSACSLCNIQRIVERVTGLGFAFGLCLLEVQIVKDGSPAGSRAQGARAATACRWDGSVECRASVRGLA